MNSVGFSPSLSPVSSKSPIKSFLQQARDYMRASDFEGAIQHLTLAIQKADEIEALFDVLLELIPHYDRGQFGLLIVNLPTLLAASSHLSVKQGKLAIKLAEWHISYAKKHQQEDQLPHYLDAMDYYAVAIKIAVKLDNPDLVHANHILASHLLIRVFSLSIFKRLEANKGNPENFRKLIESISFFERYCCVEEDQKLIQEIYEQAGFLISKIFPSSQKHYKECLPLIERGSQAFVFSKETMTECYNKHLKSWRSCFDKFLLKKNFDPQSVRGFQKEIVEKLREIFQLFLEDVIAVSGDIPCEYNIRALGSIGREEPCIFSDLESMILIEKDEHKPYFQKLFQLLEFQVVSLGETNNGIHPLFTCLGEKHRSGFHIDPGANPISQPDLMRTPKKMADLQLQEVETNAEDVPTTPPNQVLKSGSLLGNDQEKLFSEYQEKMYENLENKEEIKNGGKGEILRHARALQLFKTRMLDFKTAWTTPEIPNPIHIKKHYVELLNFFLADMALYYGIQETNSLDIIEALVSKDVFSQSSGELLKEAVAFVYCLRLRLHQFYKEQKEEGYLEGLSGYQLKEQEIEELKKIYWLVLRPLYKNCLQSVIEENAPVETVFSRTDLLSLCLDEVLFSPEQPSFFLPMIRHLAKETNSDHIANFKRLSSRSNLEILRQEYVKVLVESQASQDLLKQLREIPNRAGLRLNFQADQDELKQKIINVTMSQPHTERASQVKIISSQGERYLRPELVKKILNEKGEIKNDHPSSAHRVASAEGLHFKQKPTHPLMEYAIHNLCYRLAGDLTPSTELVRFEVDGEKMYPVLISKSINGKSLKEGLRDLPNELGKTQWARWCWFLIASVLTRPGDGRLSNFILDDLQDLYCIDNDISFVEPLVKKISTQVHFCSALFRLFENCPLDKDVLKDFCLLDSDAILNGWMEDLIDQERKYLSLFNQKEREILYDFKFVSLCKDGLGPKKDPKNQFKATILFREGTVAILNTQFVFLQNRLKAILEQNQIPTPLELLKMIITLKEQLSLIQSPGTSIHRYYSKPKGNSIEDQLKWITSRDTHQSLSSLQSDVACLGRSPSHHDIEKKKLFSLEKAKVELSLCLLQRSAEFLTIGVLKGKETIGANFKDMKVDDAPDTDRQEQVLSSLICLSSLTDKKPNSVVLQHCAVLNTKFLNSFLNEGIEYLDLMYCPQITNKDVELIQKKCPKLQFLNLSGCSGLTFLRASLFSSPLFFPHLKQLHIENCSRLTSIKLQSPCFAALHARKNPNLMIVQVKSFLEIALFSDHCEKLKKESVTKQFFSYADIKDEKLKLFTSDLRNDKEFVLQASLRYMSSCQFASEERRGDYEVRLAAKVYAGLKLSPIDESFYFREIDLVELERNWRALPFASDELKNDKESILELIKENWFFLAQASDKLKNDREIVLPAVKQSWRALRFASKELQNDREFILTAVKYDELALRHASQELQNDKEIVLAALTQNPEALFNASEELKSDREIALAAVKQNGGALEFASDELKNDYEIVLAAVSKSGLALEYASEAFKNNREIVTIAVKENYSALRYAGETLRRDSEIWQATGRF